MGRPSPLYRRSARPDVIGTENHRSPHIAGRAGETESMFCIFLKSASGRYIGVYKARVALYAISTHTFKYSLVRVMIEVKE